MLWVRISVKARCTTLCDKVCQWLETGRWFSPGPPVSSTNKTDRHDITEILLKVALNTIKQTNITRINTVVIRDREPVVNILYATFRVTVIGLFIVFNVTFNNISIISWRSVLLVEETGVSRENHRPVASHWQTLSHYVVSSTPHHERGSNSQLVWW